MRCVDICQNYLTQGIVSKRPTHKGSLHTFIKSVFNVRKRLEDHGAVKNAKPTERVGVSHRASSLDKFPILNKGYTGLSEKSAKKSLFSLISCP